MTTSLEELGSKTMTEETKLVPTTIRVSKTVAAEGKTSESDDVDIIEIQKFATTPAIVTVEVPIKLAKYYNSMGVTVGISLPCYKEELPQGITKARQLAMERIFEEIPKIKEALEKFRE